LQEDLSGSLRVMFDPSAGLSLRLKNQQSTEGQQRQTLKENIISLCCPGLRDSPEAYRKLFPCHAK